MAASSVRVQRDGRIAVVRLDVGDERNLMSRQVMADLTAAARDFEDDATTSAIVLTGTSRVFTFGFDLSGAGTEVSLSERRVLQALGPPMPGTQCDGAGQRPGTHAPVLQSLAAQWFGVVSIAQQPLQHSLFAAQLAHW